MCRTESSNTLNSTNNACTGTKFNSDSSYQMNNPADNKGMDGKATQGREHDEPSQTGNNTSPHKILSKRTLAIRLDAIEMKNHENENMITSHQKNVEELVKRISEDTAIEWKKVTMRDAMLNDRLDATERKYLEV